MDHSTRAPGHEPTDDPVEEAPAPGLGDDAVGVEESPAGTADAPDYKDRWLRAEADLQNFRKRALRDWDEGRRMAEEAVLLEMVSVLDDLERALAAAGSPGATAGWSEGVALVAQRIRDFLGRQGVTVEEALGRRFDPAFHEALLELDAPEGAEPGTVIQVIHKGYRRGERALRAARVVVARAPAGSAS